MNKLLVIVFLFILFSCKKEEDVFKYKLEYSNPSPANKAEDVALRGVSIGFGEIIREGLANYINYPIANKVYFDTINPPKLELKWDTDDIHSAELPSLKPNKTYYWAFTSSIPPGEIWSDIESFTTSGFYGDWQLENIADKRGYLERAQSNGYHISWDSWNDWTDKSYKYIQNVSNYGRYIVYTPNKDSILGAGLVINKINFSSNKMEFFKSNTSLSFYFNCDENKGSATIQEAQTKIMHNFVAVNVGYMEYYNKVVLLIIDEKGIMFIYSRKSK